MTTPLYIIYVWQNGILLSNDILKNAFIILSKEIYKEKESPFIRLIEKKEKSHILSPSIFPSNDGIEIKFLGAKSFYLK